VLNRRRKLSKPNKQVVKTTIACGGGNWRFLAPWLSLKQEAAVCLSSALRHPENRDKLPAPQHFENQRSGAGQEEAGVDVPFNHAIRSGGAETLCKGRSLGNIPLEIISPPFNHKTRKSPGASSKESWVGHTNKKPEGNSLRLRLKSLILPIKRGGGRPPRRARRV
jgi:hypothetical protein